MLPFLPLTLAVGMGSLLVWDGILGEPVQRYVRRQAAAADRAQVLRRSRSLFVRLMALLTLFLFGCLIILGLRLPSPVMGQLIGLGVPISMFLPYETYQCFEAWYRTQAF